MRMKSHIIFFFFFIASSALAQLSAQNEALRQESMVLDLEEVWSNKEEGALIQSLQEFERATKSKLLIISVGSMENFSDFDQYALYLLDKHNFHQKLDKNGLALVFSGGLRKIHLNTEMERRKIVEDSVYQRIVNDLLIPSFKEGDYQQGIERSVSELLRVYNN